MRFGIACVALAACLAVVLPAAAQTKGHLVLVGGGEEPDATLVKFIELAGGKDAPIIVFPTASEEADAPQFLTDLFTKKMGCTNVRVLDVKTHADALKPEYVELASKARGVFFGGGDQVRITTAFLDTPLLDTIRKRWEQGAVVGGASAGMACQSEVMITGEGDFTVIRSGAVETKRGLGFVKNAVVDQHFIKRQRQNRLFTVLLEHPGLPGIAVDEDTAAWIKPDGTLEVVGNGQVMIIEPAATVPAKAAIPGATLLGGRDLRVHILLPGERYDIDHRKPL